MKKITRQRSCPRCGTRVGWQRMTFKSTISARWSCPGCGAQLEFDGPRRVAVAGAGGLATGALVWLVGAIHWWVIPVGVVLYIYIWSFDSVRLVDPTVSNPGPDNLTELQKEGM